MPVTLTVHPEPAALPAGHLWVVGRRQDLLSDALRAHLPAALDPKMWELLVGTSPAGDDGRAAGAWLVGTPNQRVVACVLPEACSRHNTPSRAWAVPRVLAHVPSKGTTNVLLVPSDASVVDAQMLAVARAFPTYDSRERTGQGAVHVACTLPIDAAHQQIRLDAVRLAANLVDRPPNELDVDAFVHLARQVARSLPGVRLEVIEGTELREAGLGGLWGVGKAAECPPALVVLDHGDDTASRHDAWVGKGIVYDTGGLSIKSKTGMPGMKSDMGGAAAVLAAFQAAVASGTSHRITAVLCLAENAIGPGAIRPDDILHMYSGRTVEVNNTDAEGRLVLADGVAWVVKHREPDNVIELATLTGAQSVATGQNHAAVVCNDDALETAAVHAGRHSGDLVHPLPFAPEFHAREFRSQVADLKNSVKNRANAQASCAAEFVRQHALAYKGGWLHVDMAAPSTHAGRGTGFGVGLLLALLDR